MALHWVVPSAYIVPKSKSTLKCYYKKIELNPQIKKAYDKTHSERIGYVTALLQHNVDISVVAKLVNHKDIRSTLKYDRHLLTEQQKRLIVDEFYHFESCTKDKP